MPHSGGERADRHNRAHFATHGILTVHLVGLPAGKTALFEATAHAITTGSACPLDARMMHDALHRGAADGADWHERNRSFVPAPGDRNGARAGRTRHWWSDVG
jgi:hypothetical protein